MQMQNKLFNIFSSLAVIVWLLGFTTLLGLLVYFLAIPGSYARF